MIEWIPVIVAEVAVGQGEHLNPISDLAGQFGVNWKFLFAQIANFCIVAFLLYKFALRLPTQGEKNFQHNFQF